MSESMKMMLLGEILLSSFVRHLICSSMEHSMRSVCLYHYNIKLWLCIIMFSLINYQARLAGQQKKRWLLVNLQDSKEFSSQILNRDVWSNHNVKELIKLNFIFLQVLDLTSAIEVAYSMSQKLRYELYEFPCKFPRLFLYQVLYYTDCVDTSD